VAFLAGTIWSELWTWMYRSFFKGSRPISIGYSEASDYS
jgi:hypothetical protein